MSAPVTPSPEGKQLAADLANAGRVTRPQGEPSLLTGAVLRAVLVIAAFAALLHFTDRLIAGWVQCEAAQSCPHGDTP